MTREELHRLLQDIYFDSIDGADAGAAVQIFSDDVRWVHTQVWEHHGHTRRHSDELHGRAAVQAFLARRIEQMQVVGITHRVNEVILDGDRGAFRAAVAGPGGIHKPFFGWVELEGRQISAYIVSPEQ